MSNLWDWLGPDLIAGLLIAALSGSRRILAAKKTDWLPVGYR
jgi:hypothetical protein